MDEQKQAAQTALRLALANWAGAVNARAHVDTSERQSPAPTGRETGSAGAGSAAAAPRGVSTLSREADRSDAATGSEKGGRGTPSGHKAEAGQ